MPPPYFFLNTRPPPPFFPPQASPPADPVAAANVRLAARDYRRATAIPADVAKERALLESRAYAAWCAARAADDFALFEPELTNVFAMARRVALLIEPATRTPYDVLLDEYEPGMTAARLEPIFAALEAAIVPLLALVRAKGTPPPRHPAAPAPYPKPAQAALCDAVVKALGFDTDAGRLDVSPHPFTGGTGPSDVRMTTRFKEGATLDDLAEGITGATHECGHALYEQGLPRRQAGLPVGRALSLGAHESQSLFWERCVGLSPAFSAWLAPQIAAAFPDAPAPSPAQLYASFNELKTPSYIRVEADELHYPLHIILRFRLERAVVEGRLAVADLPAAWDDAAEKMLGARPPSPAKGVLQDMHWSSVVGYFPTYVLGALAASQLFDTVVGALGGEDAVNADIEAGRFGRLKAWLNDNVHARGARDTSLDEWLTAITGRPLDAAPLITHLARKVVAVYQLDEGEAAAAVAEGLKQATALGGK